MKIKQVILVIVCSLFCTVARAADKPNILVIMGDDIGIFNLSTYTMASWVTARPISTASRLRVASL